MVGTRRTAGRVGVIVAAAGAVVAAMAGPASAHVEVSADKAQAGWVMEGSPMTRATSADGRWVYTLYSRPGGYPFVHALDTVNGVAHCIGLPWRGDQAPMD